MRMKHAHSSKHIHIHLHAHMGSCHVHEAIRSQMLCWVMCMTVVLFNGLWPGFLAGTLRASVGGEDSWSNGGFIAFSVRGFRDDKSGRLTILLPAEGHGQKLEYLKIMMKTHHGQYNKQNLWILRWHRNDMLNGMVHRRRG